VLVADDSPLVREILSKRVSALGLESVICDSARSAESVDPAELSCALLDLDLGDGNGADVAMALRTACPDLPIAFFSASAVPALADRARTLGPVFVKPDELEAAIAWIRGRTSG
jgi:CheY-like chemotaxis protein